MAWKLAAARFRYAIIPDAACLHRNALGDQIVGPLVSLLQGRKGFPFGNWCVSVGVLGDKDGECGHESLSILTVRSVM